MFYVYCAVVPTAVIDLVLFANALVLFANALVQGRLRSVGDPALPAANRTLHGLWYSVVAAAYVTDVLKVWIARPLPDFLERCGPAIRTPLHEFVITKVCTAPLGPM